MKLSHSRAQRQITQINSSPTLTNLAKQEHRGSQQLNISNPHHQQDYQSTVSNTAQSQTSSTQLFSKGHSRDIFMRDNSLHSQQKSQFSLRKLDKKSMSLKNDEEQDLIQKTQSGNISSSKLLAPISNISSKNLSARIGNVKSDRGDDNQIYKNKNGSNLLHSNLNKNHLLSLTPNIQNKQQSKYQLIGENISQLNVLTPQGEPQFRKKMSHQSIFPSAVSIQSNQLYSGNKMRVNTNYSQNLLHPQNNNYVNYQQMRNQQRLGAQEQIQGGLSDFQRQFLQMSAAQKQAVINNFQKKGVHMNEEVGGGDQHQFFMKLRKSSQGLKSVDTLSSYKTIYMSDSKRKASIQTSPSGKRGRYTDQKYCNTQNDEDEMPFTVYNAMSNQQSQISDHKLQSHFKKGSSPSRDVINKNFSVKEQIQPFLRPKQNQLAQKEVLQKPKSFRVIFKEGASSEKTQTDLISKELLSIQQNQNTITVSDLQSNLALNTQASKDSIDLIRISPLKQHNLNAQEIKSKHLSLGGESELLSDRTLQRQIKSKAESSGYIGEYIESKESKNIDEVNDDQPKGTNILKQSSERKLRITIESPTRRNLRTLTVEVDSKFASKKKNLQINVGTMAKENAQQGITPPKMDQELNKSQINKNGSRNQVTFPPSLQSSRSVSDFLQPGFNFAKSSTFSPKQSQDDLQSKKKAAYRKASDSSNLNMSSSSKRKSEYVGSSKLNIEDQQLPSAVNPGLMRVNSNGNLVQTKLNYLRRTTIAGGYIGGVFKNQKTNRDGMTKQKLAEKIQEVRAKFERNPSINDSEHSSDSLGSILSTSSEESKRSMDSAKSKQKKAMKSRRASRREPKQNLDKSSLMPEPPAQRRFSKLIPPSSLTASGSRRQSKRNIKGRRKSTFIRI